MNSESILRGGDFLALVLCLGVLISTSKRRLIREYVWVVAFVSVEALSQATSIPLLFYRRYTGLGLPVAYRLYFYSHWLFLMAEAVLLVAVMFNVFSIAMRPLVGLHGMGKIIFRWIAAISLAMTLSLAIGSRFLTAGFASTVTFTGLAEPVQQGISVLLLCLMLFVCFATRPLGLTFRSRIFGVTVGLGIYAAAQLLETATASLTQVRTLYSPVYLIGMVGGCVAYSIWGVYFALPDPKPRMILLPTTSPYFAWNKVSEVLGDDPGSVVISGFTPDMLAPGELHVITAMSKAAQAKDASASGAATLQPLALL